ncbi:MAG: zinc-ribbon domain-containing protein [Candidatus Baldrarchaeia archaeon]
MGRRRYKPGYQVYSSLAVGLILIAWGILSYFGIFPGSIWVAFAGFWILGTAISILLSRGSVLKTVLYSLKSYKRVKLDHLAKELSMRPDELRAAIVDLRAEGKIDVRFDPETGEIIVGESFEKAREGKRFCQYCGETVPETARFCPSCGSYIEE